MLLRRLPGRLGRHGYALVARGRRGSSPRAKGDVPAGWDCAPGWTRSIRRVAPEVCFIDSTGVLWIPFAGRRLRRLRRAVGRSWQSVLTPLWREGIEGIGRAVGMGVTSRERNLAVDGARACAAVRQLGIDCSDGQDPCWLDWAVVMGDVDEQWCFGWTDVGLQQAVVVAERLAVRRARAPLVLVLALRYRGGPGPCK